jgi:hypothetical protein
MALTKGDDFPIHQTPRPQTAGPRAASGFDGLSDSAK